MTNFRQIIVEPTSYGIIFSEYDRKQWIQLKAIRHIQREK